MSARTFLIVSLVILAGCAGEKDTSQYAVCGGCGSWHRIPRSKPEGSPMESLWADKGMKAFVEGHLRCNTNKQDPMQKAIRFQEHRVGLDLVKEDAPAPKPGT